MIKQYTHAHFFSGCGGFAKGGNQSSSRVGSLQSRWRCLGGIDYDQGACADFKTMTGVAATCMDLFTREQYFAFHGREPPEDWREASVDDVRRAFGNESPTVVCLSAPCKGFSGLLSQSKSETGKYLALNELALRGLMLALEAWKDNPPHFYLFENVPRISVRGRDMIDQIIALLAHYGYAARETKHDCGELAEGGMAQSRKRFLLVARHIEKVPPHLYIPHKHPLRAVGSVLGRMALPGDRRVGPMHRVPSLSWKTWVRLAFVEAGKDWRSLNKLAIEDGMLRDFALQALDHAHHVESPRFSESAKWNEGHAYGVLRWKDSANTIGGQQSPGQGYYAVSDPRPTREKPFRNVFRVVRWDEVAKAVTAGGHPTSGGVSIADPRTGYGPNSHRNKLKVLEYGQSAGTVTCSDRVGSGALSVADPRAGLSRGQGDAYLTCGHYGVVPWKASSGAVTGRLNHDNGWGNVADPRAQHESNASESNRGLAARPAAVRSPPGTTAGAEHLDDRSAKAHGAPRLEQADVPGALPPPNERLIAVIQAADQTWHRPFTTLELAALQGLIEPEEHFEMEGLSDRDWRERIGNAVPPPAAKAIFNVLGTTLLLAESGETFILSSTDVWVRDVAVALALPGQAH